MKRLIAALAAASLLVAGCSSSGGGRKASDTASPSSRPPSTTAPVGTSAATTTSPPATRTTAAAPPAQSFPLNGMEVADLSFVGNDGWALGTAGCVHTSGRCSVLARSTDGGRSWRSLTVPPGHVVSGLPGETCSAPCVQHVRFATPQVGYLFGPGALYLSTDGGRTWHRQPGGAEALESLDGNVIRIDAQGGCSPPGCSYTAELSGIGGTTWQRVALPAPSTTSTGAALARSGSRSVLLVFGHPAGGAQNARSTLYASADDGRHWTKRGEPCPQGGQEADSVALTSAADGSFTVLCRNRSAAGSQFVATSTDGGAHFTAGSRTALGAAPVGALGAASARVILVSSDDTYRSTDGGRHFVRLSANGGSSPGPLGWLGFATSTVGHAISIDRRTIWTTTDAGRTWQAGRLH